MIYSGIINRILKKLLLNYSINIIKKLKDLKNILFQGLCHQKIILLAPSQ